MVAFEVEHRLVLPGTAGPEVVVRQDLLGMPHVLVAGTELPRQVVNGRPAWAIPMADGREKLLFIRGSLTGLQGAVEGERVRIERPIGILELALSVAPLLLALLGVSAGLIGLGATIVNQRLLRIAGGPWIRLAVLAGSFVVAAALGIALGAAGAAGI